MNDARAARADQLDALGFPTFASSLRRGDSIVAILGDFEDPPKRGGLQVKDLPNYEAARLVLRAEFNAYIRARHLDPQSLNLPPMTQPIQRHNSLPDAICAAADRASTENKKVMVLEQNTKSGDILYGSHPMNDGVGPDDDMGVWEIRYVIEAKS